MKITETTHDNGRAFRTTRERGISMKQALDIHDPFVEGLSRSVLRTSVLHDPATQSRSKHGFDLSNRGTSSTI